MKKRSLSIIVLSLLLAGILSGCGRDKQEEEPVGESPVVEETPDPHAGMVEVTNGAGGTMWVDDAEALDDFAMDRAKFVITDGIVSYEGEGYSLMRGIDVSDYQNSIDWAAVKESGIEFAILRCGWRGYSGGSLNEDNYFLQNLEGATAAGLKVGAYFFSQATSLVEGAEEAVFAAKILGGHHLDLPVFFDWERIGTEAARTDGVDAHTVTQAALEFCRLLESEGYQTGVYSYIPDVYSMYELDELKGVTIWMGDPGTFPEYQYEHDYWQYSFSGSVPGIEGNVDMNVMYVPLPAETEAAG